MTKAERITRDLATIERAFWRLKKTLGYGVVDRAEKTLSAYPRKRMSPAVPVEQVRARLKAIIGERRAVPVAEITATGMPLVKTQQALEYAGFYGYHDDAGAIVEWRLTEGVKSARWESVAG